VIFALLFPTCVVPLGFSLFCSPLVMPFLQGKKARALGPCALGKKAGSLSGEEQQKLALLRRTFAYGVGRPPDVLLQPWLSLTPVVCLWCRGAAKQRVSRLAPIFRENIR
jgi:hypothetical protein